MSSRILVVDDEEDFRIIIRDVLSSAGMEVVTACDGQEGLASVRTQKPDIILVDWMMPRMDGEQFCRALRQREDLRRIPVIMLTVRRTADEELEALHFGVDDFIIKPFKAEELLARVRAALRRARTS